MSDIRWAVVAVCLIPAAAQAQVLGTLVDVSEQFQGVEDLYFVGNKVESFDADTGEGTLRWNRYSRQPSLSFNKIDLPLVRANSNEFPGTEYDRDPVLPFSITLVSPRTVRLRFSSRDFPLGDGKSLMLTGDVTSKGTWEIEDSGDTVTFTSSAGQIRMIRDPWHLEFYDKAGRMLTRTYNISDTGTFSVPVPFSFVKRASDLGRSAAASFTLSHDEKIYGCGESFTRLNKRGQKVICYTRDGMGVQSQKMYKPIPFFMSSNGYGMFVHTSTPVTFDFGNAFDQTNVIYTGDEMLDIFVFLGEPKEILEEYTALTGRSPVPPLWSFGLWMSRITYKSEKEVRDVAAKLREHKVPCDVIHLDTGWFETDWQCNYKFSPSRFDDPAKMIKDLKDEGFRICLWQLPYFTSKNELYDEIVEKGYAVADDGGKLPNEDAILDFSNPATIEWYNGKLTDLLKLGVAAIKVDFGEDAPLAGLYHSGRTGWYEHNLYPLRYNKTVGDLTEKVTGEHIIWARSAWAGSQRYPLHWGGDAENTDSAMAATLRGGLSFGLSGFTYWSHDAGGFVNRAPKELYRRWLPFSALSSHTRCHGAPPREPWEYGEEFENDFRRTMNLRYGLMPYIYAQAQNCSKHGYPMVRPLFFEFPGDPTSWLIDDEYLFGESLLVAPLFSETESRRVYLPPGQWIDYQTGSVYDGAKWHEITAGEVPIVVLVKNGSVIPHIAVAQSTDDLNWDKIELRVFSTGRDPVSGLFALPNGELAMINLEADQRGLVLREDPSDGKIEWQLTRFEKQ